jgi:hypothetical protein
MPGQVALINAFSVVVNAARGVLPNALHALLILLPSCNPVNAITHLFTLCLPFHDRVSTLFPTILDRGQFLPLF